MTEIRRETLPDGRLKVWYWTPKGCQTRVYSLLWGQNSKAKQWAKRLPRN